MLEDLEVSRRTRSCARRTAPTRSPTSAAQRHLRQRPADHFPGADRIRHIGIGHSTFRLKGSELSQFVDQGAITFTARDLVVTVNGGKKTLMDQLSLSIPEKCLVGVLGPSGAGKSTLLGALTGMRPADTGTVLTTAATCTPTTTSSGTGSGWSRRRTSCTPS